MSRAVLEDKVRGGHDVTVYNRTASKAAAWVEKFPGGPENLERSIDHELAEILGGAELAGFGANGFVFRVPGDKIPSRFADDLRALGERAEVPVDVAMKMLKVYEAGTAAREVAMHQRAWEAVREHADDPDYASVPRVYFAHTAHFTKTERQHLTELGFQVGASADVILMDFVPGRDLKEILAEQVMQPQQKMSVAARGVDLQRPLDLLEQRARLGRLFSGRGLLAAAQDLFGGADQLRDAVNELQRCLYAA